MTEYIIWILLTSFWCWGFHNAFEDGEIFGGIGNWLRARYNEMLLKPFIGCPICMPSTHGTLIYLHAYQGAYSFTSWIMFIVCVSGLNYIIYNLFPPSDINVKNNY